MGSAAAVQEAPPPGKLRPFPDGPLVPPARASGPEFFRVDMPREQLRLSPLNPRKHFDETRLRELADTFAGVGIIEPLVARPAGDHYEIVCGARRWMAAGLAQLPTVPVIVKPLTDTQALEIMVVENNQREDVSALEEAEGFRQLLDTGYELEKLAERLGRSKKYVYDRIKLLELVPAAKQLLADQRITAGHAILLARLKPKDQARAVEPVGDGVFAWDEHVDRLALRDQQKQDPYAGLVTVSVREFEAWIDDNVRIDLAKPIEPDQFPDLAGALDASRVVSITHEYYLAPDAPKGSAAGDRVLTSGEWRRADGSKGRDPNTGRETTFRECSSSLLGVVVIGRRRGTAFQVCVEKSCDIHWKKEREEKRQASPRAADGLSKEARARQAEENRKWKEQRERAETDRKAWVKLEPLVVGAAVDQVRSASALTSAQAEVIGDIDCYDVGSSLAKVLGKGWFKTPAAAWLALAIARSSDCSSYDDFVKGVAKPLGLDLKPLEALRLKHAPPVKKSAVQTSAHKSKAKKKR